MRAIHLIMVMSALAVASAATAQQRPSSGMYYPAEAQEQGIGGRVTLECLVGEDGRLTCEVTEETPANMSFGAAALATSRHWRIAPRTRDGTPTAGGRMRRTLVFEPGPPARVVADLPPQR